MSPELLVAGGGIGGLAAAIAARRAGWEARVFEQAEGFSRIGAGIQLGPNVTRILREWQVLDGDLEEQACRPPRIRVRDAVDGAELAALPLSLVEQRYGAPYITVHRADLQTALLRAAHEAGARLHVGCKLTAVTEHAAGVRARAGERPDVEGDALVAADGLWSVARAAVAGAESGPPTPIHHLAYRGMVKRAELPIGQRSDEVRVWLAPRMHLVTYPVRGGDFTNFVCVVEGRAAGDPRGWDHEAVASELERSVGAICTEAGDLLRAVPAWRLWMLHDRPPVASADAMAQGRIALLGDAAHPMRPYLAQGAGMAIEDAREVQRVLEITGDGVIDVPLAFRKYAANRWPRVAQVQARSRRNGTIFHAAGPLRWSRNLALRTLGPKLLDQPWLYGY